MTIFGERGRRRREAASYSDWMSQLPPELHDVPLFRLAIPGSHDSMSYDLDVGSSIIEPERLRWLSWICCVRRIVRRWATTQEETVSDQLDAGVRYFDLRIARKRNDPDPTRLFFHHGLYTQTDVESVLKVINEWAEKHPKEVLILAFSHFKGFDKKVAESLHAHLMNFIKTCFGSKLLRRGSVLTLKKCWDQGGNIIISYEHPAYKHPEIWGKITYFYGKSMSPTEVETKLCYHLEKERPYQKLFVCGLNLTLPEDGRILRYIVRLCDNFTNVVHRSLPRLVRWLKEQAAKTPVNIVASDLVTRDNFISTIVNLNLPTQAKA